MAGTDLVKISIVGYIILSAEDSLIFKEFQKDADEAYKRGDYDAEQQAYNSIDKLIPGYIDNIEITDWDYR